MIGSGNDSDDSPKQNLTLRNVTFRSPWLTAVSGVLTRSLPFPKVTQHDSENSENRNKENVKENKRNSLFVDVSQPLGKEESVDLKVPNGSALPNQSSDSSAIGASMLDQKHVDARCDIRYIENSVYNPRAIKTQTQISHIHNPVCNSEYLSHNSNCQNGTVRVETDAQESLLFSTRQKLCSNPIDNDLYSNAPVTQHQYVNSVPLQLRQQQQNTRLLSVPFADPPSSSNSEVLFEPQFHLGKSQVVPIAATHFPSSQENEYVPFHNQPSGYYDYQRLHHRQRQMENYILQLQAALTAEQARAHAERLQANSQPQIIITNMTEAVTSSKNSNEVETETETELSPLLNWCLQVLSSRTRQCFILCGGILVVHFLRQRLYHSWRVQNLQIRSNVSILMRVVQILNSSIGAGLATREAPHPSFIRTIFTHLNPTGFLF